MSLRDEMALYTELTGEDGTKVPIRDLGNFLWGYEIGIGKGRPQGKWIGISSDGYADGYPVYDEWECSNCGHEIRTEDTPPFCEICGSEMEIE